MNPANNITIQPLSHSAINKFWIFFSAPQNVFFILALSFGTVFTIITPPFQSPDEPEHFYRAYEISEGYIFGQQADNRLGGSLPESVNELAKFFLVLRWNPENHKTSAAAIIGQLKVPLTPDKKKFVDFPNTAIYPPVAYLPQVFTITIARWIQIPPLLIFYLARLTSLICWILLVFHAIKIIPGFKWYFTFLALLPMSLSVNTSVSADVLTNGISFLFIASVFRYAFTKKILTRRDWLFIILLMIILASSKIIYASIALLIVIIPAGNFNKPYSKYFFVAVVFTTTFFTMLLSSALINNLYIPFDAYNPDHSDGIGLLPGIDIHQQLHSVIANPFHLFEIIPSSVAANYKMYMTAYIGVFGWLEIFLPAWLILLSYFGIFIVLFLDQSFSLNGLKKFRITLLIVSALMIYLIFFSQFLNFTPPGDNLIEGVQGRYFIPVFPLLFLAIRMDILPQAKLISTTVFLLSIFCLSISIAQIYRWYY